MVRHQSLLLTSLIVLSITYAASKDKKPRRKTEETNKSLWKSEYESELTDAMMNSRKRDNITRVVQSTGSDTEAVLEKLMDSLTSSEKYLKKVDGIDFRLNRLDIEVHEKTNNILKYLTEMMKVLRSQGNADKLETVLDVLRTDLNSVKLMLENHPRTIEGSVDSHEPNMDSSLNTRLTFLEGHVKSIMAGVDSIVTTISEVKNRQHGRNLVKSDGVGNINSLNLINEFRRTLQDQKTKRCECKYGGGRIDRSERYPTDCHEIQMQGFNVSGIYKIKPEDMDPFYVLCDLTTVGGGWTVVQNRFDGSQDFYKNWSEYKYGFGNLAGEFWLGLEKLHYLTNQKLYELRIEMETQHGHEAYASYSVFTVGPEYEGYRISTLGTFYGTAGDSLSYHAGQKFSTLDVDNDEWRDGACAMEHGGAWWYKECDKSNLNGMYSLTAEEHRGQTIYWISFKGPNFPLTKTKMMIRPLPASRPIDYGEKTRKILDSPKVRLSPEKQKILRGNDMKGGYDANQATYRYDEPPHVDSFFSNYS